MGCVASEFLAALAPDLPPSLVPAGALGPVRQAASALGFVAEGGFECRLGPGFDVVDFQVCLFQRQVPLGVLADGSPGAAARQHPAWRRILPWLSRWADPLASIAPQVGCVWFEFDLQTPPLGFPPSVLFLLPSPGAARELPPLLSSLEHFQGAPLSAAQHRAILRCHEALPAGRSIVSFGLALGRPERLAALTIASMAPPQSLAFLRAIGWPGDAERLLDSVGDLTERADRLCLMVAVGDEIAPRLGLEFYIDQRPRERWPALLDRLVARGLCTADKRAGLLAWEGASAAAPGSGLERLGALLGARAPGSDRVARTINHIKVSCQPSGLLDAKGYLAFRPELPD